MSTSSVLVFRSKDELKDAYEKGKPSLLKVLNSIEADLRQSISLASMPTFKSRIKNFNSYYRKLLRVHPPSLGRQKIPILTDLLGIRVICAFLEDIAVVEKQITARFNVLEIERKGSNRTFSEFGYESVHILISIPAHIEAETDYPLPADLVCEIQIRTILQDAWAEVEHELVYKSEFSPFDLPLRRKLASMNASLSLADIVFQEIRDYQNKLNDEMDQRRNSFYKQADMLSEKKLDADHEITKTSVLYKDIGTSSPYVKGTIDDMLLEAIHAHNTGNLERAIAIYSRILGAMPSPNTVVLAVIYKHRGMAFFAQNKYEEAKEDFLRSVDMDVNNFRSLYYVGIIHSVLNNEEKALEYFDKSLELNKYQAHVYYRKALSLFHLSRLTESLESLTIAADLGLDDDGVLRLRQAINEKLEMQQTDETK